MCVELYRSHLMAEREIIEQDELKEEYCQFCQTPIPQNSNRCIKCGKVVK